MKDSRLYFLGLLPDDVTESKVRQLKEHFSKKYGAVHALKSPVHLTLQKPIKRTIAFEPGIKLFMEKFVIPRKSFSVSYSGFGCFDQRVVYVNLQASSELVNLYESLREELLASQIISSREVAPVFHPHFTIAHRDINPDVFNEAWNEFSNMEFEGTVEFKSISILKHNFKLWEPIQTCFYRV